MFGAYGILDATMFLPGKGKHSALLTYGSVEEAARLVNSNANRIGPMVNVKLAGAQDVLDFLRLRRLSRLVHLPG